MEIPNWFGQSEYYALLITIWFGLIIWLLVSLTKIKLDVKDKLLKFKSWYKKRKVKKQEKLLN